MLRIAIIQFPGLNTEYETRREINRAGMIGEFFRWNDNPKKLEQYDGYVIGGGFSYEDRGRAGIIAALDPIMKTIKVQAEKGKPVLGICNGAQILVESGLIPGVDGEKLAMALARNKRMRVQSASAKPRRGSPPWRGPSEAELINKVGEVLGTGYYNAWVHLKCTAEQNLCLFTTNIAPGELLHMPIAHGEGRFTTEHTDLMEKLRHNGQMVFRYCDAHGVIKEEFPTNPNGSAFNIAALCNSRGNVMAIMPHIERDSLASEKVFSSMRDGLLARTQVKLKRRVHHLHVPTLKTFPLPAYKTEKNSLQFLISLIITDNEAETFELTLKNLGFDKIGLKRFTHYELNFQGKPDLQKLSRKLIQSGVLLNTNKEFPILQLAKGKIAYDAKRERFTPVSEKEDRPVTFRILIREKPDFVGLSKLATIQNRLKLPEITNVRLGTLWEIHIPTKSLNVAQLELKRLLGTNLFRNPHRQEAFMV